MRHDKILKRSELMTHYQPTPSQVEREFDIVLV
jgi:hypothetical protein